MKIPTIHTVSAVVVDLRGSLMLKDDGTSYIHSRHLQNCVEEMFHHLGALVYLLDLLLLHYTALTVYIVGIFKTS